MSIKINELAEKLSLTPEELRAKLKELGFEVAPKARVIDNEIADLVLDELSKKDGGIISDEEVNAEKTDVAEIYDELIATQREREIVKSQRKKTAGKDVKVKKSGPGLGVPQKVDEVAIPDMIAVKEFAEKTGISAAKVIGELMKNGILANINQQIDFETAQIVADDLGIKLKRIRAAAGAEDFMAGDITKLLTEDDPTVLHERPPVVVVMGHVDHGKTKLLDSIRETDVVSRESGGITQHIGAYQVEKKGKLITFLDTPGHEAFTAMRARGARVTDIAILVVAADEGVKPQTIEALNHAREAEVPILVAVNKIDKPDANLERVKGELTEHGLQPEDWGGNTVVVPVSALTKQGIDELLDMILLTAEMENLKANPNREAVATVIEAHLDHNLGPVATVLVNTGTLKIMNNVIVGNTYGRIKLMRDHYGKNLRLAGPSTPVLIAGLHETPRSGDILQVVRDEKTAREKAEEVKFKSQEEAEGKSTDFNQLLTQLRTDKVLKVVLKADAKGSLEAIRQSIAKIKDEEVAVKVIHSGVGTITESDVMMASASGGVVLAFHSEFDSPNVSKIAERENVEIRQYKVIYDLLEDIRRFLSGLIAPEIEEIVIGKALVKQIFLTKKKEMIIGAKVTNGKLKNKAKLKVWRREELVGEGSITMLRKVDEIVDEIKEGNDCGIKFVGNVALEEGDVVEAFEKQEKRRTI